MGGRLARLLLLAVVLVLVVPACGDDEAATTTTTTVAPSTTGAPSTTAAPWGEAVSPGAEAMLEDSRVLLREDFQDGNTAGWNITSGWYLLGTGERRVLGAGGEAWAWHGEGRDWARYGMRLAVLVRRGGLGLSVAVGLEGRYLVHLSEAGVYLLKDAPYGTVVALGAAQGISLGEAHVVAVGLDGGHLQVYVDGVLLIDATDPTPLAGGTVGLGAGAGALVAVDNVVVASLSGPLPQMRPPDEPAEVRLPDDFADGAPAAGEVLHQAEPADPGMPNLALVEVGYPVDITYGEGFDVLLTVANTGEADAGGFEAAFLSHEERCNATVDGLAAGDQVTVPCHFPGYAANGHEFYEWTAAADSTGVIDEGAFEDDNLAAGTITVVAEEMVTILPNVKVAWTEFNPATPRIGDEFLIQVGFTQTTQGWDEPLPDLVLEVSLEGAAPFCRETIPTGQEGIHCHVPAFAQSGEYWMVVTIDATDVLAESHENDNTARVSVLVSPYTAIEQGG
jgi:hypothetical protein